MSKDCFHVNFDAKQAKRMNAATKRLYKAISAYSSAVATISPDMPSGEVRMFTASILNEAAAQIAIKAAYLDYSRNPKKSNWVAACKEAFDRALDRPVLLQYVVTFDSEGGWKMAEQSKP